jgi:hypothetical protein
MIDNRERRKGDTTVGSGIHSPETAATGLLPTPSGLHRQGNQSTAGSPNRFAVHNREEQGRWAGPNRSVKDRNSWGILRRPGTHRLVNRAQRDIPSGWGIRSRELGGASPLWYP